MEKEEAALAAAIKAEEEGKPEIAEAVVNLRKGKSDGILVETP